MIAELLIILLIVLILWPKPVLGAAKWVIRQAWGKPPEEGSGPGDGPTPGAP